MNSKIKFRTRGGQRREQNNVETTETFKIKRKNKQEESLDRNKKKILKA